MYKCILVPVDSSEFAAFAVDFAAKISRHTGASLELAHVHEPFVMAAGVPMVDTTLDLENQDRIDRELASLRDRARKLSGNEATLIFLVGSVVESLSEYVRLAKVDLVVMTSRGRSGIRRALFGSVASGLIQALDVPILFARPGSDPSARNTHFALRRVVVPLDGSRVAEAVIEKTVELTKPESTEYLLLRVLTPLPGPAEGSMATFALGRDDLERRKGDAQKYLAGIAERLRSRGITATSIIVVNSDPARTILGTARTQKADMIAIATHGAGAIQRIVLGSVADKIIRTASLPTLAYRPPGEYASDGTPSGNEIH